MPTKCERSVTSPTGVQVNVAEVKDNLTTLTGFNEDLTAQTQMMEGDMSTSQTSTTSNGSSSCNGGRKTSITSPDPTAYVAKARVTRPTPPPPPYNPMQFVQIKPCNLYQTAQEQLKKAEKVKKIKEIRKEEPEDWQNNLDNWKSSRRKRVEHIIDRVVEVKKLELEEHDRTRRKSKTFSEMIEERGERSGGRGLNKLASLAVYAEDEANDLSDLGIGTSSASGKSSLSEDYDNNSVMSDNAAELDKAIIKNNIQNKPANADSTTREYISSPGYETCSSTAPASSPDPCEYTYEGAIQDYKQRVSRAASGLTSAALNKLTISQRQHSKESTPERPINKETAYPPRRGSKIEDRLMGFEVQSPSEECVEKNKVDVPKIDISKRKEIFEPNEALHGEPKSQQSPGVGGIHRLTLRDRFKVPESTDTLTEQPKKVLKRLSGDITSIKERLQSLEQQQHLVNGANAANKTTANKLVDIPVPPLRERLSSLKNAVTKEEVRKPPVVLIDARQLEIMKSEDEKAQQTLKEVKPEITLKTVEKVVFPQQQSDEIKSQEIEEADKDDSGIHTADDVEVEERVQADRMKKEQELQLNAAIEALAKEEKQLSEAANAVNQIEAEFEELSLSSVTLPALAATNSNASSTPITNEHMEYSVSSTNPPTSSSCSNNCYSNVSSNNNNISETSGNGTGNNISDTNTVKGIDIKTGSNLRRKPTNEMVHAKNLLKIFKETFQTDFELGKQAENVKSETTNTKEKFTEQTPESILGLNITKPIDGYSKNDGRSMQSTAEAQQPIVNSPHLHPPSSMIPRSIILHDKPPTTSPISIKPTTKFVSATSSDNPSLTSKNDSQFSINGRVEIFNSKTMTSPIHNSNLVKATTPTMTAKKIQLPHIIVPILTAQSNDIVLPNQHKNQPLLEEGTTKQQQQQQKTTVIEPLSTISLGVTTRKIKQRQQNDSRDDGDDEENNVQLKTMPSEQMVNELEANPDGETYYQHQPNYSNKAVKQQKSTEIVVCAPPITIVNPDELPKPNTVKNLSNCFQQQQKDNSNAHHMAFKPLSRTRIPQITSPHSPAMARRHVFCCTSPAFEEELTNDPPTAQLLKDSKKFTSISAGSTVIDIDRMVTDKPNISSAPSVLQVNSHVRSSIKEKETELCKSEDTEIVRQGNKNPCGALVTQASQSLSDNNARTLTLNINDLDRSPDANCNQSTAKETVSQYFTPALSLFESPLEPLQTNKSDLTIPASPQSKLTKSTTTEICPNVIVAAEIPPLLDCPPNESTLYKLANSAPHTPNSPGSNSEKNLAIDSALCSSLFTSLAAATPAILERQHTVEEDFYHKVDKESLPFDQIATGFKDISSADIRSCDGITSSSVHKFPGPIQTQRTVVEELCQKLDINNLPDNKKNPTTGYKCISPTEIRKCDSFVTGSGKSSSKPNSPIVQARAAHSKALIETCEKIIAEERLTSSQLKSSLPSSPIGSPVIQRKSKIPKPITSCCKATESLNEADINSYNRSPTEECNNGGGAIARLHVVETQIKVTTTTPPTSPKVTTKPQASPQSTKKTKNIFDFLKKNFSVGGHSHKEKEEPVVGDPLITSQENNNVLVLSEEEAEALEKVKYDEVHKFDNSKFYIPTNEINDNEMDVPPPLPKTPAPVNIEITRKIITDEILENDKTEKDLSREIDDLLDDEYKKLNYEIEQLEKVAKN